MSLYVTHAHLVLDMFQQNNSMAFAEWEYLQNSMAGVILSPADMVQMRYYERLIQETPVMMAYMSSGSSMSGEEFMINYVPDKPSVRRVLFK